jgi:hypothetical protein
MGSEEAGEEESWRGERRKEWRSCWTREEHFGGYRGRRMGSHM